MILSTAELQTPEPHILIVDDHVEQLRLLVDVLRNERFRLSVAFDGAQGVKRAAAIAPDLIVMDVRMPAMDGFVACRLLKADPATAQIPVIFLTASDELDERLLGLQEGGVDYILKPFEPAEVLARIRIHLALSMRQGAAAQAPGPAPRPRADEVIVNAAMRHLRTNLGLTPSLKEIASQVGTHEKRLSKVFKQHVGMTVFEFLRKERLRVAQRLLRETSLSVLDIANEIGFSGAANFATAFREHTGMTPTDFRRQTVDG
ncbi:hypothetical protein GCM10023144_36430 [Pigmentiphaga soli]|uniref:DNA-binding response regulator n=1 Tax=Pigmentiphaga soli TaxID=1007095 RepID=A0ABP8HGG2_9BURK